MTRRYGVLVIVFATVLVASVMTTDEVEDADSSGRCTAKCVGGPHDKCTLCGTVCPLTCAKPQPRACTKQCAVNVCRCEEGYVRNSQRQCVKPNECPRRSLKRSVCTRRCTGGPHDRCTLCGSACPRTCNEPNPQICTMQCLVNVCECKPGYVRNAAGQCVEPQQCSAEPRCTRRCTGGRHDKCTMCGSACPRTCDGPRTDACTLQCILNVCQCEPGYVRASNGQCIRPEQCPQASE